MPVTGGVETVERLEVRLDTHTKRNLEEWAHSQDISLAEAVRQIIQERLGFPNVPQSKAEAAHLLLNVGLIGVPGPEALDAEIHDAFGE
jgi:hypothetical protein